MFGYHLQKYVFPRVNLDHVPRRKGHMTKESLKNEINKLKIGKPAIGNVTSDQFTAKSLLNLNHIWIAIDLFQFLFIFITIVVSTNSAG